MSEWFNIQPFSTPCIAGDKTESSSYLWLILLVTISIFCLSVRDLLSHVWLFATPQTVAYQAPLSMEFSRQEYWSGWSFPSSGDLPEPGIEPGSPTLQADFLPSEAPGKRVSKSHFSNINSVVDDRGLLWITRYPLTVLRNWGQETKYDNKDTPLLLSLKKFQGSEEL